MIACDREFFKMYKEREELAKKQTSLRFSQIRDIDTGNVYNNISLTRIKHYLFIERKMDLEMYLLLINDVETFINALDKEILMIVDEYTKNTKEKWFFIPAGLTC